jgi:ribonuclease PH
MKNWIRADGRRPADLRSVKITRGYLKHAEGSVLFEMGDTKLVCTATVQEEVPPFLRGQGKGWVTAEYGMLPRSSAQRIPRESSRGKVGGRTQEIQRLIGRALRAVVDLEAIGERTVWMDCDVLQADGGTRTAAINGAFIALVDAVRAACRGGGIKTFPVRDYLAAISVGRLEGRTALDLAYSEDSTAQVDMNVVMTGSGKFVEVQGTAEAMPFSGQELEAMLRLAGTGIQKLIRMEKKILGGLKP